MEIFLNNWKTIADIIQSAVTSIAIFAGGVWTYFLFVRNRLDYPKVIIKIEPQEVPLPKKKRLIHAKVNIKNVSKVILRSTNAELRLRYVVPLTSDIEAIVNNGYDPVLEGNTEIQWPMVVGREWIWKEGEFEIEPDEDGSLHADYIINDDISVVEFYFFIENAKKKQLGWSSTLIYELKKKEE